MSLRHAIPAESAARFLHPAEATPLHVLVVDASALVRALSRAVLTEAGYPVTTVADGVQAQAVLMTTPALLLIADRQMPASSDWSLLMYCRTRSPTLPVLIFSNDTLDLRPEIELWAAGFLPKPFNARELCAEVDRLFSRVGLRPQVPFSSDLSNKVASH